MADDMIHLGHGSQHLKLDLAGRQKGWGRAAGVIGVSTRTLVGLRVAALSAPVSVTRNGRGQRGTYGGLFPQAPGTRVPAAAALRYKRVFTRCGGLRRGKTCR